ncbi:YbhB/YbcL family Raf kinase inhibitor-like protein [Halomarina ordinaria]|uniref:YbhB/YbcL family Raf kinase inhibitor-like protein n=1 Tax=Halomarina ordinaria TaxID=3033939 RepID=A0ABD5UAP3_9EURY|nr:YbhB/YbcL family Raf kinase inhibitor-like protein [Halomarina sp. PSRA2]
MTTPLDGEIEQEGDLKLTSPAFDDGDRMPDSVGYANENEHPPLHVSGVPEDAESLVLVMDDPDAEAVAGHVWDHWLVYNVDPDTEAIPAGETPEGAITSYNDFVEQDWGGPAPPEGEHDYYFKLLALDTTLDYPAGIRKARLGSAIAMEATILAQTQLVGRYDAEQGTAF